MARHEDETEEIFADVLFDRRVQVLDLLIASSVASELSIFALEGLAAPDQSVARCFAVPISQAPGRSGTPEVGHCSSAATRASCASSSAVPMSPTVRVSPAMSRADSIRHIASIARCASAVAVSMANASSRALVLGDLTDLEGPAILGCAPQPLDGLLERAHLPRPVTGHELLGLGPRPVDHGALLALEPHTLALRARGEPAG